MNDVKKEAEVVEAEIVEQQPENLTVKKEAKKSWEQLVSMGIQARTYKEKSQWMLGDLALEVTVVYGDDSIGKYAREINVEKGTLARYRQVSKAWPLQLRSKFKDPDGDFFLSHRHFQMLAPRADKEAWMDKAMDESWSSKQLEVELKREAGNFKEDLAVASITLVRGEFEEIIRWYDEVMGMDSTKLNEFSHEVLEKIRKGLKASKKGN